MPCCYLGPPCIYNHSYCLRERSCGWKWRSLIRESGTKEAQVQPKCRFWWSAVIVKTMALQLLSCEGAFRGGRRGREQALAEPNDILIRESVLVWLTLKEVSLGPRSLAQPCTSAEPKWLRAEHTHELARNPLPNTAWNRLGLTSWAVSEA